MNKIKCFVLFVFSVFVISACSISSEKEATENGEIISKKIVNVDGDLILDEVVPCEWEKAYSFRPYVDKNEIESVVGFSDDLIKESYNDNYVNLVFVNKNEVVATIYGEQSEIGYNITFNSPITKGERKVLYKKNVDGKIVFTE